MHWHPDVVWDLTLPDALAVTRGHQRVQLLSSLELVRIATTMLGGGEALESLKAEIAYKLQGHTRPTSIEEEFGPEIASEVEEMHALNRERTRALRQARKAGHGEGGGAP